ALWLLLASSQVEHPAITAPVTVLAAWSFVVAGLVAWTSRPDNRTGVLMVLTGFLLLAGSLADTTAAVPFTVGVLLQPWAEAVFAHLLLAFPQGRLHSRFERVLVTVAYLDVTVGQFVMLLFMDSRIGTDCPCPENLLFIHSDPQVHDVLMTGQRLVGVLITAGIVGVLARRWQTATPPLRRSLAPGPWTGAAAVLLTGAALAPPDG